MPTIPDVQTVDRAALIEIDDKTGSIIRKPFFLTIEKMVGEGRASETPLLEIMDDKYYLDLVKQLNDYVESCNLTSGNASAESLLESLCVMGAKAEKILGQPSGSSRSESVPIIRGYVSLEDSLHLVAVDAMKVEYRIRGAPGWQVVFPRSRDVDTEENDRWFGYFHGHGEKIVRVWPFRPSADSSEILLKCGECSDELVLR